MGKPSHHGITKLSDPSLIFSARTLVTGEHVAECGGINQLMVIQKLTQHPRKDHGVAQAQIEALTRYRMQSVCGVSHQHCAAAHLTISNHLHERIRSAWTAPSKAPAALTKSLLQNLHKMTIVVRTNQR